MNRRVTLEDGTYGRKAILCSAWSEELETVLRKHGVVELELNTAKGWRGTDLSFLTRLSFLQAFDILDLTIEDVTPIHALHKLRRLGVTTYCSTEIRFSEFPLLENCALEWRSRAKSLFDCKTLKSLFVNRYKGKDTEPFSRLTNLESLAILNAPIVSLHGLTVLDKLTFLRLAALRCLNSLGGIEHLKALEVLHINTCRRISSVAEVGSLFRLRKLFLNNCGDIESLKPLSGLTSLEWVTFYESTNIVDGDLSPLHQKKLSSISFQNRRHYSHKREAFDAF
jgi:hypothetical protein